MKKSLILSPLACVCAFMVHGTSLANANNSTLENTKSPFSIAIHGGAGTIEKKNFSAEQEKNYRLKLKEAIDVGYEVLQNKGTSIDAVIAAVQVLEASPYFNAGVGAVYTYEGSHELDASIMDGNTLNAGAVSGVKTVKSPIALANAVKDHSVHVMLSGEGAEVFAKQQNLELVSNDYFDTKHRYQQLLKAKAKLEKQQKELKDFQAAHQTLDNKYKYGTVGAVALDQHGNLAAATSTGGMTVKRFGRVGDAPIIGAGTYANNASCAVSATGHGEYFIRYHVAADICARMEYQNISLEQASNKVVNDVLVEAGGSGGVIAVDAKGNIAMPFNSKGMYRASRKSGESAQVAIFKEEK